jgi:hypothetical protein
MEPVATPRAGVLRLGEPMVRPRRPRYRARLTPEAPFAWDFQTYRVVNKLCDGFQQVGSEVLHMLRGCRPQRHPAFSDRDIRFFQGGFRAVLHKAVQTDVHRLFAGFATSLPRY